MNIKTICVLYLIVPILRGSEGPEHKHATIARSPEMEFTSHNADIHLTIDIPERNPTTVTSPRTPADLKRLKIKVAAITAIITAVASAVVSIYLGISNCKT